MTLRTKTSLLLAVITFLALGVTSLFYLQFLQQVLKNSILSGVKAVADSNAEAIATLSKIRCKTSRWRPWPCRPRRSKKMTGRPWKNACRQLAAAYPKFENGLFILDRNGRVCVDYPPSPKHGVWTCPTALFPADDDRTAGGGSRPRVGAHGPAGADLHRTPQGLGQPGAGGAGLLGEGDASSALGGIRNTRIGKSGYIYVYDKTRLMILHPEVDRVLKRDVPPGSLAFRCGPAGL